MKAHACASFNVMSTSVNGNVVATYDTFEQKINYFYHQGGTDRDLINCVYQIHGSLLQALYKHITNNSHGYKDTTDFFGFSALYYFHLRPIAKEQILHLESIGFREKYPSYYKVEHFDLHSFYSHVGKNTKTAIVFLGKDESGAVDINAVHAIFTKGYNVISIDARFSNIYYHDVYKIAYQYSKQDIELLYISSHGNESSLRVHLHTIPILGHDESITSVNGNIETTYYARDSINTATFIKGISYAANGYWPFFASFLTEVPTFGLYGKELEIVLSSCDAQLSSFDTKSILAPGSRVFIIGENHYVHDQHIVVRARDQDDIRMLDSLGNNFELSAKSFLKAYLNSIDVTSPAPYYMEIYGHTLLGRPILNEFSCLTVKESNLDLIIKFREDSKNNEYIDLLNDSCEFGFRNEEPNLENLWTKEFLFKFVEMVEQDAQEAREEIYGYIEEKLLASKQEFLFYSSIACSKVSAFFNVAISCEEYFLPEEAFLNNHY
ncbi:hypothetical protein [Candidatus Bandiella numerosa]|uniref:hypothetical protein n=1 Tax=Candidatus Bandiella numerosa TaxID=2570586 RepID=UPI001F1D93B5|nr:hypothetical protein [Candidatus Bandiella numerosa]